MPNHTVGVDGIIPKECMESVDYLCHKSASKIADIPDCDERTVKRWIKEPF